MEQYLVSRLLSVGVRQNLICVKSGLSMFDGMNIA
jgi:hypothetical protein